MSNIKFEKCNEKEINDKCEVISVMADEIAELREMLRQMVYLLDNGYDQNNSHQEDSVIDAKKLLNK